MTVERPGEVRKEASRSIAAAHAAFAARDHQLMRRVLARVPWGERPLKLHLKRAVASLPPGIALPVNAVLQRIAEGRQPDAE